MKKFFITASLVLASVCAKAEGYQVNLQSARQTGMGHVGTALKLGAESMFYNPAGLSFMNSRFDFSFGASAVMATVYYENGADKANTNNPTSTPMFFQAAYKISDKLAAGISVTNPYGSSLEWGDAWYGAELVQNISLQSFNVQPTLSYRVNEKLSVGAGLMINFGNVSIAKQLIAENMLTSSVGMEHGAVSLNLDGKADAQFGFNLGVMYDFSERFTMGLSYRSKVQLEVSEGDVSYAYGEGAEAVLGAIASLTGSSVLPTYDESTFSAAMPMPANLTLGAAYKLNSRLMLSADLQTVFWSSYEQLDIKFNSNGDVSSSVKDYKNTIIARVGAEYNATKCLDIRAGVYFDQSPVQKEHYSPETPGMDKYGFSAGLTFRPTSFMAIDLAFLYIHGTERYGEEEYTSTSLGNTTFSGNYSSKAFAPSLGIRFMF